MGIVCGIGIYERGEFAGSENGRQTKMYAAWSSMIRRCTQRLPEFDGYRDCRVSDEFLSFQRFAGWAARQVREDGYHLDKDLLVKGNQEYAPDKCVFLPPALNWAIQRVKSTRTNLPIGVVQLGKTCGYTARITLRNESVHVGTYPDIESAFQAYKLAKEKYIRELTAPFLGLIDQRAYDALMSYNVEITD